MKILVVDDDVTTRVTLRGLLGTLGHEVTEAADGAAAWEALQRDWPPIVITDWLMPDPDGLELCRMIRAENRKRYTYVIMLTVVDGKGAFLEGMKAGADDFLAKPFDAEQLAARLRVAERILGLQAEIKQLEGLLPVCSYCGKIRDEGGRWLPLQVYIAQRTDASFSHGICPTCFEVEVEPRIQDLAARRADSR